MKQNKVSMDTVIETSESGPRNPRQASLRRRQATGNSFPEIVLMSTHAKETHLTVQASDSTLLTSFLERMKKAFWNAGSV